MVEFAAKHQTLARVIIVIFVALAWCFSAYVAFASSQPNTTLVRLADLALSAPAGSLALCKGVAGWCHRTRRPRSFE
jgi:hypothetical protein